MRRTLWQALCEDGALAGLARHCHIAAHHARELARERKTGPPAVPPPGKLISRPRNVQAEWERIVPGSIVLLMFAILPMDLKRVMAINVRRGRARDWSQEELEICQPEAVTLAARARPARTAAKQGSVGLTNG